jgi:hypothetical protein
MGYGGVVKTIFRVAATVVGGMACGPPCAALGSAVATGATGGSFKEALMSGATAYIGASITQGISSGISDAAGGSVSIVDKATGLINVVPAAEAAAMQASGGLIGGIGEASRTGLEQGLFDAFIDPATDVNQAISGTTEFLGTPFGSVNGVTRTSFDFFKDMGNKVLGEGGLGLDLTPLQIANAGDLLASGVGGLTTLTLDQALQMDLPGLDETLGQAFGPEQIAALRQEQRNAMSQQAFNRLTSSTENPFGTTPEGLEEFNKVIAGGIERENVGLGPNITEAQFSSVFDNPDLGDIILGQEEDLRRQAFNQQIGQAFPGDSFQALDDEIISSIVDERRGPAQKQVSTQEARGNLNPFGGQTANVFLSGQEPGIESRIRDIGEGVLGSNRRTIGDIQDRASQSVTDYSLGDPLFDVAPFSQERSDVIAEREGTLGADVRGAIGAEPLFDVRGALAEGGRTQGLVSGSPSQGFLDTLAAREQASTRDRRGLGSRGSGAF